MHRITSQRRDMAFRALADASDHIGSYRRADTSEWKDFWRDVIRDTVAHARTLRLNGIEYPRIP